MGNRGNRDNSRRDDTDISLQKDGENILSPSPRSKKRITKRYPPWENRDSPNNSGNINDRYNISETRPQHMYNSPSVDDPHHARPADTPDQDHRYELSPDIITAIREASANGDSERVRALVHLLHQADIADLFEQLNEADRAPLAQILGDMMAPEILAEMNEYVREDIIETLQPDQIADMATQLDSDDAVALIEDLEDEEQRAVLAALNFSDRRAIEDALTYPEKSAGRIMQRDFVAVPEHINVGQLIDHLREHPDLTSEFWEVFVVDPLFRPVGTCQLSLILRSPRHMAISDIMKQKQTLIPVTMDQEEVAIRFQKYNLISAAIIDDNRHLVGMITVDDILHIVEEEASEDILRLSGAGDGDIHEPIHITYSARIRWLLANLITALVASAVIAVFGRAIEKMVALAVLMPIVASVGGNAGTQAMAVIVRALALNEITSSNRWRIIRQELSVATLNGLTIAAIIGIVTALLFENNLLGLVIALAMLVNIFIAGAAGLFIPSLLDRLGQDPALASSVFVTMVTDTMGFLAFLGLAVASGLVAL